MFVAKLVLALTVVVGLVDGKQVTIDQANFTGFIESRDTGDVLLYRDKAIHGELKITTVKRIDFGYEEGNTFLLTVTLKNGQKLELESASRNFVTVKGVTNTGSVTINHPEPIVTATRLTTGKPNRKKDLTIQYLEFPQ